MGDPDQASDLASDTLLDQNQWFMDPFVQKSCAQAVQRMEQLISKPFLPLIAKKVLKTAMMALRTAMKVSKTVLPMPKIATNCLDPTDDACTKECLIGPGPCLRENAKKVGKCVADQAEEVGKCVIEQQDTLGKCIRDKKLALAKAEECLACAGGCEETEDEEEGVVTAR